MSSECKHIDILNVNIEISLGVVAIVFDEFGDGEGGVGTAGHPQPLNVDLRVVESHVDGLVQVLLIGHGESDLLVAFEELSREELYLQPQDKFELLADG